MDKIYQKILTGIILISVIFAPISSSLRINEAAAAGLPVVVTLSVDLIPLKR